MLRSITALVTLMAMAIVATAQSNCGGIVSSNGTYYTVKYYDGYTVVTIFDPSNPDIKKEDYMLNCATDPSLAILSKFQIPLKTVAVEQGNTASLIELISQGSTIKLISNPNNVVSPCLQAGVKSGSILAINPNDPFTQYQSIDGAFTDIIHPAQTKDILIPSTEIEPMERLSFIKPLSLFFGAGVTGEAIYNNIKASYEAHRANTLQIPKANRKRIGWVRYDISAQRWEVINTQFVRAIIRDAGGVSFPLNGDILSNTSYLEPQDMKNLVMNSQIIVDQSDYDALAGPSRFLSWLKLAGFSSADQVPAAVAHQIYSLDNTVNPRGSSDYPYRAAARPDLLLLDLIRAQYGDYNSKVNYTMTFMNRDFSYQGKPDTTFNDTQCGQPLYNDVASMTPFIDPLFVGDRQTVPPPTGSGQYGNGDNSNQNGNSSKADSSKTGIIVAVVAVAAIVGAGFVFAFFKWSKRAKEDRFIELEEEMNNEIPLH